MRLTQLHVTNYRALRDVQIPLSRFACLIGENNSGKSSVLQALSLFFSGSRLTDLYFFDPSKPIRIAVTFEDITDADLARLPDERHRAQLAQIIKNGRLVLVRKYDTSGKSSLLYEGFVPKDPRFAPNNIEGLMRGGRPGKEFMTKILETFPELEGQIDTSANQEKVKQKIQELADRLPESEKTLVDQELPTGLDKSIGQKMLPDVIYIPAVKDLADDVKTKEGSSFGKILNILLQVIEPQLPEAQRLSAELNAKLNRIAHIDGTVEDSRLDAIKLIESTIEQHVRRNFLNAKLLISIPPPELKTILGSAAIIVDDGIEGPIDSKGDGLRRAVVFAILRAYVELRVKLLGSAVADGTTGQTDQSESSLQAVPVSYILLFEEPELFLYPKAQQILFDALKIFAQEHHVLVTTHSPLFFGAGATETFVKLRKVSDALVASKPFTQAQPIDLSDITIKDQFQMICFENNNAAFFADTVVLVEGDSEYLLMPHIARTLDPSWDVARLPVVFARITGKGNIRRYRAFFKRFGVRVAVIADLDILVHGFEHIEPDERLKKARGDLLSKLDQMITDLREPSTDAAKKAHSSGELRSLWKNVLQRSAQYEANKCTFEELKNAMNQFLAWQRKDDRLSVLKTSTDPDLVKLKHDLLDMLRQVDVYVLERGSIEDYYPQDIHGDDKPSLAHQFCATVTTREAVLACCGEQIVVRDGVEERIKEFEAIFQNIFAGIAT